MVPVREIVPHPPRDINSITIYDETHGFARTETCGMTYIMAADWKRTNALMDYEQKARRAAEARADGATKEYG